MRFRLSLNEERGKTVPGLGPLAVVSNDDHDYDRGVGVEEYFRKPQVELAQDWEG